MYTARQQCTARERMFLAKAHQLHGVVCCHQAQTAVVLLGDVSRGSSTKRLFDISGSMFSAFCLSGPFFNQFRGRPLRVDGCVVFSWNGLFLECAKRQEKEIETPAVKH